ncbi:hypothetical protein IRJ41_025462 [Triplophysa rosa]|uniref:Uncharacterized protein n=1 Tax=Triplophysa rosa TaxID=992332 RepID=A0A9W7TJU7_TRIRA|nr:hypothetical protein IRJ41_025462 [Triplophysa rosa]
MNKSLYSSMIHKVYFALSLDRDFSSYEPGGGFFENVILIICERASEFFTFLSEPGLVMDLKMAGCNTGAARVTLDASTSQSSRPVRTVSETSHPPDLRTKRPEFDMMTRRPSVLNDPYINPGPAKNLMKRVPVDSGRSQNLHKRVCLKCKPADQETQPHRRKTPLYTCCQSVQPELLMSAEESINSCMRLSGEIRVKFKHKHQQIMWTQSTGIEHKYERDEATRVAATLCRGIKIACGLKHEFMRNLGDGENEDRAQRFLLR